MSNTYKLTEQGFLKVAGPDAIKFLQGYTTCDLLSLTDDKPRLGAICNLQGRMISSFLVIRSENDLILRMQRALVTKTIDFLKKYIVFSKAELLDMSDLLACYGSQTANEQLAAASIFTLQLENRFEYWCPAETVIEQDGDSNSWRMLEIDAGIAWVSDQTSESFLPQMFNYHELGGIDFDKGCYLGQEIVARAQYRGELKRRLHRLASNQQRAIGDSTDLGVVVAAANNAVLAVLNNSGADGIETTFDDGEQVTATPC